MDSTNSQIYKYAKYLDKYTKTSNKKGSVYLQKLDKYLHKVQHGGDVVSELVTQIQSIVERVIETDNESRQRLDEVVSKVKEVIGKKHSTEIVLGEGDNASEILKKAQPFIDRYKQQKQELKQLESLTTDEFEVFGYYIDSSTSKYTRCTFTTPFAYEFKEKFTSDIKTKLSNMNISDINVDSDNSYKPNISNNTFKVKLSGKVPIYSFAQQYITSDSYFELPIVIQGENVSTKVMLFVSPVQYPPNLQLTLEQEQINKIAVKIDEEIKQKVSSQSSASAQGSMASSAPLVSSTTASVQPLPVSLQQSSSAPALQSAPSSSLESENLITDKFDVVGYVIDPSTNRVKGKVEDAKYIFPIEQVTRNSRTVNILQNQYQNPLLQNLNLLDQVNIINSFKVTEAGVRIVLNNKVNIVKFVNMVNDTPHIIELPNESVASTHVRLFIKPMTFTPPKESSLTQDQTAINELAKDIAKKIVDNVKEVSTQELGRVARLQSQRKQ